MLSSETKSNADAEPVLSGIGRTAPNYEAVLIVSFGGPEASQDVIPFLENVLRGRNVPRERLLEVAKHYEYFGGVSPLNAQNRELAAALQTELQRHDIHLQVYLGNRNWHPFLADILRQMRADGVRHALGFFTSAFSSYSSCRQYLKNIAAAQAELGADAPRVHKLRTYFNHPGFIEPMIQRAAMGLKQIPEKDGRRRSARLVFTAHSIPLAMSANCSYELQLRDASQLVASTIGHDDWNLVYQSRSGPSSQAWLEPDINHHLRKLAADGVHDVVVIPIGFISDHIEVLYDLDLEAKATAEELGINMIRVGTVGTDVRFVKMIQELIMERMTEMNDRPTLGKLRPCPDVCAEDCCLSGRAAM
ncbi:MAG TPA: ferrochelatase [Pirellulales bacterium]|jgi:ferrochelatase|nr:ferrochelatase [Pirellulales bacterium]